MLIRKIKIKDSIEVGDVELDFCDENANPYRTIIIAGGNGTGKTLILERIYGIISGNNMDSYSGEFTLEFEFAEEDIPFFEKFHNFILKYDYKLKDLDPNILDVKGKYKIFSNKERKFVLISEYENKEYEILIGYHYNDDAYRELIKCFYSEASIIFQKYISSHATGSIVNDAKSESKRTEGALSRDIIQLFTDLRIADNEDRSRWEDEHPGVILPEEEKNKRLQPFLKAIQYMFPNKKFKKITQNNGFIVEFEEFGRKSTINDLSSGEKQIIFRGGFFLKNISIIEKGVVLIDEPELSLHPEWQSRIVGFYHHLFSSLNACPQIIIVTHSPFVIHGALGAKTIVLHKNSENGQVAPMDKPTYPTVGGDAALFAFNIDDFLARNKKQILLFVEGQTDVIILTEAWKKLRPDKNIIFEATNCNGARMLNNILNGLAPFDSLQNQKIVGLFDFDNAFCQWKGLWKNKSEDVSTDSIFIKKHKSGKGYAMLLPVPEFRKTYASLEIGKNSILCIEFLFEDKFIEEITEWEECPLEKRAPKINSKKKVMFAESVNTFPEEAFSAFEPLFQNLEKIYKNQL